MPKTHYSVADANTNESFYDGHATQVPAVGDSIEIDGTGYVVKHRRWKTAEDALGADDARGWGHGASDIACVTIYVSVVSQMTGKPDAG